MKICQITYSGFGGLGSVVFSLIDGDTDHNTWYAGFIGDLPIDPSYEAKCRERGIEYGVFRSTPGKPYFAWLQLAGWLFKKRPDVVICHSINSILACRVYGWVSGARVLAVQHTPNNVKTRPERVASRLAMLLSDAMVVLTPEYREELRNSEGRWYRERTVVLIPNGIDADRFHPATPRRTNRSVLRLGMAARFSFSKRQDLLLAAAERVAELAPDVEVELTLAGDGSELDRVKALSANNRRAKISFEGRLTEEEVAAWLQTLDVYLQATEGETLSTSLLQAMASGLPIIASDAPGVRNLFETAGEYGWCVPNEVEAFARQIQKLHENRADSAAQGARSRARILHSYSHRVMWSQYRAAIAKTHDDA